jgi:hypothetical protein
MTDKLIAWSVIEVEREMTKPLDWLTGAMKLLTDSRKPRRLSPVGDSVVARNHLDGAGAIMGNSQSLDTREAQLVLCVLVPNGQKVVPVWKLLERIVGARRRG